MKIAVVGAGAMGSLFGALLSESGARVCLFDLNKDHVAAINRAGLCLESAAGSRRVRLPAVSDPAGIEPVDLALIFVKSLHTRAAARSAAGMLAPGGQVLTLQNGMGHAEIIAGFVDPACILAGTTAHGATFLGPGHIRHAGVGQTVIGPWDQGGQETARAVAGVMTKAGIDTRVASDVRPVMWEKLMVNVGINAITALTGSRNGRIAQLPAARDLARAAVAEAAAVARALSVPVRPDIGEHVLSVALATAANRSSMGQDVDAGRPTEIGAINAVVVREADRLGLAVPVNRTLTTLVEMLERVNVGTLER